MKQTWQRILCAGLLSALLCIMLIACKDPVVGENPEDSTPEVSSSELSEPSRPDPPLDDKVINKGENTDPEWGNDVIA